MHRRFWVKNSVAVQRFAAPARLSILVRIARHHRYSRDTASEAALKSTTSATKFLIELAHQQGEPCLTIE